MHTDPQSRRQRVATMLRQPQAWQICCGCDSVIAAKRPVCPNCGAYRFLTFEAGPVAVERAIRKLERQKNTALPE